MVTPYICSTNVVLCWLCSILPINNWYMKVHTINITLVLNWIFRKQLYQVTNRSYSQLLLLAKKLPSISDVLCVEAWSTIIHIFPSGYSTPIIFSFTRNTWQNTALFCISYFLLQSLFLLGGRPCYSCWHDPLGALYWVIFNTGISRALPKGMYGAIQSSAPSAYWWYFGIGNADSRFRPACPAKYHF